VLLCGSWAKASRIASGRGWSAGDVTERGGEYETTGRRLDHCGGFAICHLRKITFPLVYRVCLINFFFLNDDADYIYSIAYPASSLSLSYIDYFYPQEQTKYPVTFILRPCYICHM